MTTADPRAVAVPKRLRLRLPASPGRCYRAAYKAARLLCHVAPEGQLIHGVIVGHGHAWIEVGALVYDPATAAWYDRADFYASLAAFPLARFSVGDVERRFKREGIFGPWVDPEAAPVA